MKRILASLSIAAALAVPISSYAMTLQSYEDRTTVAHQWITGAYDARWMEVSTDLMTQVVNPIWKARFHDTIVRYCSFGARNLAWFDANRCVR